MTIAPRLHRIVAAQPYPLLFATLSGAQLQQMTEAGLPRVQRGSRFEAPDIGLASLSGRTLAAADFISDLRRSAGSPLRR